MDCWLGCGAPAAGNGGCLGCPRNNQNFFSVRTETNRKSICFGCFSVCFVKPNKFFFGLFRFFGPVSKQPKQTKTNRKNLQKANLYEVVLETINFFLGSNQNKPKLNLFWLFFGLFFSRNQTKFFSVCFGVSDRY
jgi:hypothetical protein